MSRIKQMKCEDCGFTKKYESDKYASPRCPTCWHIKGKTGKMIKVK